jgi:hypothetical protein
MAQREFFRDAPQGFAGTQGWRSSARQTQQSSNKPPERSAQA